MLLKASQRVHPSPQPLDTTITAPASPAPSAFIGARFQLHRRGTPVRQCSRISLAGKSRDQEKGRHGFESQLHHPRGSFTPALLRASVSSRAKGASLQPPSQGSVAGTTRTQTLLQDLTPSLAEGEDNRQWPPLVVNATPGGRPGFQGRESASPAPSQARAQPPPGCAPVRYSSP